MSLPTLATVYTSEEEITDLLSAIGVNLRLDDDESVSDEDIDNDDDNETGIDDDEQARLTVNAIRFGTAKVNLYLLARYTAEQLETSVQVHAWATTIAVYWLCGRRANPRPQTVIDDYKEAIGEMTEVKDRDLALTDIGERQSDQPTLSNVTLDNRRTVKVIRVERPISTPNTGAIPSANDLRADLIAGAEEGYP